MRDHASAAPAPLDAVPRRAGGGVVDHFPPNLINNAIRRSPVSSYAAPNATSWSTGKRGRSVVAVLESRLSIFGADGERTPFRVAIPARIAVLTLGLTVVKRRRPAPFRTGLQWAVLDSNK